MRQRPGLLVHPEQASHEVVAAPVFGAVLVDHEPGEDAAARGQPLLLVGERSEVGLEALERRLAGELEDDVALGARDHRVPADRRAALRDDGPDGHASQHRAHRSFGENLSVEEESLGVRLARAGREPADERRCVLLLVQLGEEAGSREGERVNEEATRSAPSRIGKPLTATPSSVLRATLWKVSISASGSEAAQTEAPGPVSSSRVAPEHTLRDAAEQVPRRELALDGRESLVRLPAVLGRQEQESEVDRRGVEALARLARGFARRLGRLGGDGQPRPDPPRERLGPHVRSVRTACRCPARACGRPATIAAGCRFCRGSHVWPASVTAFQRPAV